MCALPAVRQVAFSVSKQMHLPKVQDLGSQAMFPASALLGKILLPLAEDRAACSCKCSNSMLLFDRGHPDLWDLQDQM